MLTTYQFHGVLPTWPGSHHPRYLSRSGSSGTVRKAKNICLSQLRPLYLVSIAANFDPIGYTDPNFSKSNDRKGNSREYISHFIDSIGLFACVLELCLREFSKSLKDRAYSWDLNVKPDPFMIRST